MRRKPRWKPHPHKCPKCSRHFRCMETACSGKANARRFCSRHRLLKRLAAAILCLAATLAPAGAAATRRNIELVPNPEWCRAGYRCLTINDYAEITVVSMELERDMRLAQLKTRRLGCVIGAGIGISGAVTVDWGVRSVPAAHLGVTCGVRF